MKKRILNFINFVNENHTHGKMSFFTKDLLQDLSNQYEKFELEDINKVEQKWTDADEKYVNDKIRPIVTWQLKKDNMSIDYSLKIKNNELAICDRVIKVLGK